MKKILIFFLGIFLPAAVLTNACAQQKIFHTAYQNSSVWVSSIVQDSQGYIWFGSNSSIGTGGLFRFDGQGQVTAWLHKPGDGNSLSNNDVRALCMDSSGMIWIGTFGGGLDRYNPLTNTFTHFRHDPKDSESLSNDSINSVLVDHLGNIWVGTRDGLNKLNPATGKFVRYTFNPGNPTGLSNNQIWTLYEDHEGNLWIGTFRGGLDKLDEATGTFTRYLHDSTHSQSISNNFVTAIYEDSRRNLWIGTFDNGLQTLDRKTGVFTHYPSDTEHPQGFGPPPIVNSGVGPNYISFIQEDAAGNLWIGSRKGGVNKYDPKTGKTSHYGVIVQRGKAAALDTTSGLNSIESMYAKNDRNGLFWIGGFRGLYVLNRYEKEIPYYPLKIPDARAFYKDKKGGLWIATDEGLLYKPTQGKEKVYAHNPKNTNSPAGIGIASMLADKEGNLWLATYPGRGLLRNDSLGRLDKFNPVTGVFTHYRDSGMEEGNYVTHLCFGNHEGILWIATDNGLYQMDTESGKLMHHYSHHPNDRTGLSDNGIFGIAVYGNQIWIGTKSGLDLLNETTGQWTHYLQGLTIEEIYKDESDVLWVATMKGLYRYEHQQNQFQLFSDLHTGITPEMIPNIIEDNNHNLWINGSHAIYRISPDRKSLSIFGSPYGIHSKTFLYNGSYKAPDGELFLGDQDGYYAFYPDDLDLKTIPPTLNITGFELGNKEVLPGTNSPLTVPVMVAKKINLRHNQNSFSFEFNALNYGNSGEVHYRYMLEGYDNIWHEIGSQTKAYFFSVPPGHYVFKVMTVNSNGAWNEKDITVIVNSPWWTTWWAIVIFIIILILIIWGIVYLRSRQLRRANKLLEEKVTHRTEQLKKSLDELKSAQKQLIQSEKMASLGELTAGIAHEIQNPLNFVNNFSEVSVELANELKGDIGKLNIPEDKKGNIDADINDLVQNQQKINFHGKRADAIVKAMLQHSRISSGQRELTNINALADEYLRLSYHGMRAKDKSFNAEMKTDFDETIGRINVVPQDIGRVFLNLFNNAFYACAERSRSAIHKKQETSQAEPVEGGYQPTVWVSTKKEDNYILIKVRDNGGGIPEKVKDKIFQPFFTTKPTGEGTGLGLSLSYDIIKAHDGDIKVNTKEGEGLPAGEGGTEFIIQLPVV